PRRRTQPALPVRDGRPAEGAGGQRDAGGGGRVPVDGGEQQWQVRLDPEERPGEQSPGQYRRRQPTPAGERTGGQQPPQGRYQDGQAGGAERDGPQAGVLGGPGQRGEPERGPQRGQRQARPVRRGRLVRRQPAYHPEHQQHAHGDERREPQEDPPPAEVLRDEPGQRRPDQPRYHPGGRGRPERRRPVRFGVDERDHDVDGDDLHPGPQA